MKKTTRIIIADDYPMFREGLRLMLREATEIEVAGEASDGAELLRITETLKPDIVIADIEMPVMNGIEATREIKKASERTKVIALTMFGDNHLIIDMLDAGASGYLLKSTDKEELKDAIEIVSRGGTYFCNSTSLKLSSLIANSKVSEQKDKVRLTEKETEIVKLICEQYASKQIASMTQLTHRTVEKYRDHIMQKTGAQNVVGIVIYAIREGIFKV